MTGADVEEEPARATVQELFEGRFMMSMQEFTTEFVGHTVERFFRSGYKDDFNVGRAREAQESSYHTRDALGRLLAMYLAEVRKSGRSTKEASIHFFTFLSRAYWQRLHEEEERFSAEIEQRAGREKFTGSMTREQWVAARQCELQNFLCDVFGRLAGAMNGVCVEELMSQSAVPEDGDRQTRDRTRGLLGRQPYI